MNHPSPRRPPDASPISIGFVAIGRNEGERLRTCLQSIPGALGPIVYVDSGSVDGSVDLARSFGAEVVELDMTKPFTAARARNAGIARLLEVHGVDFVMVLDGDCELLPSFVDAAMAVMQREPRVAIVCGRRRERHRDATIYNALCDMEWNTPEGDVDACGGDALIRLRAFGEAGGYDAGIIAGEEPELCFRIRRLEWKVRRVAADMTIHDAAMTSFSQWWRRSVRAGHAYAELYAIHGYWKHEVRSFVLYGFALPASAVLLSAVTSGLGLALFGAYGLLYARVRRHRLLHGDTARDASLYAAFCVLSKLAHVAGAARYWANRVAGRRGPIIEYKRATTVS